MFIIKSRTRAGLVNIIIKRSRFTARDVPRFKNEGSTHNGFATGGVYLQRVCSPPYASSSVILRTRHKSYLFNCGEDTSRVLSAHRISPGNVDHIFLSQIHWGTLGGLTSLLCDIFRKNGRPPQIHGPASVLSPVRRLSLLTAIGVTESTAMQPSIVDESTVYDDNDVRIESILIPSENPAEKTTTSYLCTLKALRGGTSAFGLSTGNVDNGSSSRECRFNDRREVKFLLLDIPQESYMSNLTTNEVMVNMTSEQLDFIIHFTPTDVYKMAVYKKIVAQMQPKLHFVLNDSSKHSSIHQIHNMQEELNCIDKNVHPLLSLPPYKKQTHFLNTMPDFDKTPRLMDKIVLHLPHQIKQEVNINNEKCEREIIRTKEKRLQEMDYPHIVFIGTGAASTSLFRSNAAILVNLTEEKSLLLDCGQGTHAQLARLYGSELPEIYRRLKGVFISHMHIDHFIGLSSLFRMRNEYLPKTRDKLKLMCSTEELKSWLYYYSNNFESCIHDISFHNNEIRNMAAETCEYLGVNSLQTCLVPHLLKSAAISITFPYNSDGAQKIFKLTYSGDTGPCDRLVELGRDSTLLIHEATFNDKLHMIAAAGCHSTVSQAIEQGRLMNAEYTILTHTTTANNLFPWYMKRAPKNVGIAMDFMHIRPADLSQLNSLTQKYDECNINRLQRMRI